MDPTKDTRHPDRGRSRNNTDPLQPAPLRTELPPVPSLLSKTAQSTPMSSPGLFSPTGVRHHQTASGTSVSESATPSGLGPAPLLHPLQSHRVRETTKAWIDSDTLTGRKLINQYEVIEEIGRGVHGKVKLARNTETGERVAIKIIPRFSKKRRLGKLSALAPQDKTKKEIAILKKIRHPNVVALLEVIDDPELKKIYMILEHVELGEVVWRKKGLPHICSHERRRVEREMRGEKPSDEEEKFQQHLERRQRIKQLKRDRMAQQFPDSLNYWSVENGAAEEASSYGQQSRVPSGDCFDMDGSVGGSRASPTALSRSHSSRSALDMAAHRPHEDPHFALDDEWDDDMETPGPVRSNPSSSVALAGTSYPSRHEQAFRGRSPSMADSIISHMSSVDFNPESHDAFADDYSYVPCFTLQQARSTFRDTVLGLEYLHYQGVVHRDIKPANMLWSKDHRVKISDFGVSYFGRPIREGEPDDTVSESEAKDFDDDLELAKTVGTPAFFAPELCYTDLEREHPKVSEQIDVWSLGVTLYCLIYARIPFLAEDEFQMFRKIATEEVYIPKQRLKPVDPSTSPTVTSLYKRQNLDPYRDDNDLEYEDVDPQLLELLRQMLVKNPEKRIRLRDIKRHPWVTQDITNVIGWLDDSDPARPSDGRKIQVDETDVSVAVGTVTIFDRARNYVKRTLNKVVHPLGDRGESHSRHRASSSVASSAGDSMANNVAATPGQRADRRKSLYPDDYFTSVIQDTLSQEHSRTASRGDCSRPHGSSYDPLATVLQAPEVPRENLRSGAIAEAFNRRGIPTRTMSAHRQNHSASGIKTARGPHLWMPTPAATTPATPIEGLSEFSRGAPVTLAQTLYKDSQDEQRCKSVDRGLFTSTDKRAQPQVSVSTAVAPGNVQGPSLSRPVTPSRPGTSSRSGTPALAARGSLMVSLQSELAHSFQVKGSMVASNEPSGSRPQFPTERPRTAHRIAKTHGDARADQSSNEDLTQHVCGPHRNGTIGTMQSSSTDSMAAMGTPLTSPSEITSPVSTLPGRKSSDQMANFQSDPSLPALLSGASSVSADTEGELLGKPGIVGEQPGASLHATTDSLTPPACAKEPTTGFPLPEIYHNPPAMDSGSLARHYPSSTESRGLGAERLAHGSEYDDDDDDDESGSDDGFLMMGKNRNKAPASQNVPGTRPPPPPLFEPRRRDTDLSIMSTETVRKVPSSGARVDEE